MDPEKRFTGLSQVFHGIFMKLHLVVIGKHRCLTQWSIYLEGLVHQGKEAKKK